MLESDYVARKASGSGTEGHGPLQSPAKAQELAAGVLREVIIPVLEKEVNEGARFAPLRQIYHSLILAAWFKMRLKDSVLGHDYADQRKTSGITTDDPGARQRIYEQYLETFRKGVYDLIREETDLLTREVIPRKYFSGGWTGDVRVDASETRPESEGFSGEPLHVQVALKRVAVRVLPEGVFPLGAITVSMPGGVVHPVHPQGEAARRLAVRSLPESLQALDKSRGTVLSGEAEQVLGQVWNRVHYDLGNYRDEGPLTFEAREISGFERLEIRGDDRQKSIRYFYRILWADGQGPVRLIRGEMLDMKQELSAVQYLNGDEYEVVAGWAGKVPAHKDNDWSSWYFDQFSQTYQEYQTRIHVHMGDLLAQVLKRTPSAGAGPVVLHLAAGDGTFLRSFFDKHGPQGVHYLLERNFDAVSSARKLLSGSAAHIFRVDLNTADSLSGIKNYEGEEVPGAVDVVVGIGALNIQVFDRKQGEALAKKMFDALRPGGIALLTGFSAPLLDRIFYESLGFIVHNTSYDGTHSLYILQKPDPSQRSALQDWARSAIAEVDTGGVDWNVVLLDKKDPSIDLDALLKPAVARNGHIYGLEKMSMVILPGGPALFIADDHPQALPFWWLMQKAGVLRAKGNRLLHIDAHPDAALPGNYDQYQGRTLDALWQGGRLKDVQDLATNKYGIQGFISPLVEYGRKEGGSFIDMFLFWKYLGVDRLYPMKNAGHEYKENMDTPVPLNENEIDILDIDLDVFGLVENSDIEVYLERMARLALKAKAVSIVTSPEYIDQARSILLARRLVQRIIELQSLIGTQSPGQVGQGQDATGGIDLVSHRDVLDVTSGGGQEAGMSVDQGPLTHVVIEGLSPEVVSSVPLKDLAAFMGE